MRLSGILGNKESNRSSTSTTGSNSSNRTSWGSSAGTDPAAAHVDPAFLAALMDTAAPPEKTEETAPSRGKRDSKKSNRSVSPKRSSRTAEEAPLKRNSSSRSKRSVSPKRGSRSKSRPREKSSSFETSSADPATQGVGKLEQKYMKSLLSANENDHEEMVALRKILQSGNKLSQRSLMKKSLSSKVA